MVDGVHQLQEGVGVGAPQLGDLPPLQDQPHDGEVARELLEHLDAGGGFVAT